MSANYIQQANTCCHHREWPIAIRSVKKNAKNTPMKVQCGVAGTLECGGGVRGGPAWQTSVVWTLAA